jgi:hypothetical protein
MRPIDSTRAEGATVKATSSTRPHARPRTRRLSAPLLVAASLAALGGVASNASAAVSAPYFSASGVGPITLARERSVAAPLPNGDVLIAGGAQKIAEVFNPATDSFSATGEMLVVRAGAVAAPLPNGDVLIAGGAGGEKTAELYDPSTGAFTAVVHELLLARTGAVAAPLPNGDVLIAGGAGVERGAELYEPVAGTFTATAHSMSTARTGAVAAPLPGGEVVIAGGSGLASAELFDPDGETFTSATGSEGVAREAAVAALLPDGQVLIAGGSGASAEKSAELFSPSGQSFAALSASLESARTSAAVAPLQNGQVLIAGGVGSAKTAELFFSAPQASVAGGGFGDQVDTEPSATSTLLVTNLGAQALTISSVSLNSPEDFAITSESCAGRTLSFAQSCTISVLFTPVSAGLEEAAITLADNEGSGSTAIKLTGTGVVAGTGPKGEKGETGAKGANGANGTNGTNGATGATGVTGATGAIGPQGAAGTPGQVILVTCTTSTKTVNHKPKKVTKCTTRPVPSPTTFTSDSLARATLGRHGFVYATGTASKGRVVLHATRALSAGRYTLTLVSGRGRHAVVRRMAVELP